jgi:hypothetical protein
MRNLAPVAALVGLVSISPPVTLQADEGATGIVTIRSYNTFSVSLREIDIARQAAGAAFRRAGIDTRWRECRTQLRRTETDRCDDVLRAGEVIVRVVTAPGPDGSRTLGASFVDPLSGGGVLATVFGDRVHAAAARGGGDAAVLLGRAVAHEVGHLLIGTSRHSRRGLMRAWWTDDELRRDAESDWVFSPRQGARMAETLIGRVPRPHLSAIATPAVTNR